MKFQVLDVVRLVAPIADCAVPAEAIGVVVAVFTDPLEGYEVEFCDADGRTLATAALSPDHLVHVVYG